MQKNLKLTQGVATNIILFGVFKDELAPIISDVIGHVITHELGVDEAAEMISGKLEQAIRSGVPRVEKATKDNRKDRFYSMLTEVALNYVEWEVVAEQLLIDGITKLSARRASDGK